MQLIYELLILYFVLISAISVIVCVLDKRRARLHRWRVRESTLLLLSFLGGGIAMFVTMKLIRHKTQHPKFMIGIPLIILFHISGIIFLIRILDKSV